MKLIKACEGGQDHDNDPVTLHLPALDRTISPDFLSRQRQQHSRTSGTVLA